jgi:hypothetical protein
LTADVAVAELQSKVEAAERLLVAQGQKVRVVSEQRLARLMERCTVHELSGVHHGEDTFKLKKKQLVCCFVSLRDVNSKVGELQKQLTAEKAKARVACDHVAALTAQAAALAAQVATVALRSHAAEGALAKLKEDKRKLRCLARQFREEVSAGGKGAEGARRKGVWVGG